jgi:hypothetical protein
VTRAAEDRPANVGGRPTGGTASAHQPDFESFPELLSASGAKTDVMRALVAAYWLQFGPDKQSQFVSHSVNELLNDTGHKVKNITDVLSSLKEKKPSLVVQVAKKGSTKQARKTYRVTSPGRTKVEEMLSGRSSEGTE